MATAKKTKQDEHQCMVGMHNGDARCQGKTTRALNFSNLVFYMCDACYDKQQKKIASNKLKAKELIK